MQKPGWCRRTGLAGCHVPPGEVLQVWSPPFGPRLGARVQEGRIRPAPGRGQGACGTKRRRRIHPAAHLLRPWGGPDLGSLCVPSPWPSGTQAGRFSVSRRAGLASEGVPAWGHPRPRQALPWGSLPASWWGPRVSPAIRAMSVPVEITQGLGSVNRSGWVVGLDGVSRTGNVDR